jgi:tryptophanyl-tRNA synthetase
MGELGRMTQFKDKSARAGESIPVGLFTYPALMAADILLYDTDVVPVGEDQKQHLEVTRDWAIRMNGIYGDDLFVVPKPMIATVGARIMDFEDPTAKMGKSDSQTGGAITVIDEDAVILKKIKRATTDSETEIRFDPEKKAGVSNLLTIQSCITGKTLAALTAEYAGKQYGHLKVETAEIVVEAIRPIREEIKRLLGDLAYLDRLLKIGAEKARARANPKLRQVYERVGFVKSL